MKKSSQNNVVFIENDFDTAIPGSIIIKSPFKRHNKIKRLFVDILYIFKLLPITRRATIIAPWGLFWIPGILNRLRIKKFRILSLSCDTFLSRKTTQNKNMSMGGKIKYAVAHSTYKTVDSFFFCSDVVQQQIVNFGVQPQKCAFQYREWIRDEDRYNRFQNMTPNIRSNNFLFIGHLYGVMQKRVDLLVEAFLLVKKRHPEITLTIVGRGWKEFFKDALNQLEENNIELVGETYELEKYLQNSFCYIHPGELEGFGLTVIESMLVGLIPAVSDETGAKDAVIQVDANLIFPLQKEAIAEKMERLISLTPGERETLSQRARTVAKAYKKENSVPPLRQKIVDYLKKPCI